MAPTDQQLQRERLSPRGVVQWISAIVALIPGVVLGGTGGYVTVAMKSSPSRWGDIIAVSIIYFLMIFTFVFLIGFLISLLFSSQPRQHAPIGSSSIKTEID